MRTTKTFALATIPALAIALSACGNPPPDDRIASDAEEAVPAATAELGPIQQASYERLNRDEVRQEMAALISGMEPGQPMPAQAEMDLASLDKDGDEKLSVAEFAIYHLRPQSPEITEDQLTDAASAFFSNDVDGSSFLDAAEFAAATGREAPEMADEDAPADEGA